MRRRVWIVCAILFAICILSFLWKRPQHVAQPASAERNSADSAPVDRDLPKTGRESRSIAPVGNGPISQTGDDTNAVNPAIAALWRAPIEFYGKVIDEKSNAVAGAKIRFQWTESPVKSGNRTTNKESDSAGLFSLHGQYGPDLSVVVGKDGYLATRSAHQGFHYALANDIISPDPQNPVIFVLRKRGTPAEMLVPVKQNYKIPRDGSPVAISLSTGNSLAGDVGDLVVRCWTEDAGKHAGEKYGWRCVVAMPGGGIASTGEELMFLAPDKGYKDSIEIDMPPGRSDWSDDVDLKFYYRLGNGTYGKMTFSMIAGGQHFCMVDSVLNPTGSRNLEPSQ